MNKLFLLVALVGAFLASGAVAEPAREVKLEITWSIDQKSGTYTNDQTKIAFPKRIAVFEQKRATPAKEDGSASFAYVGEHGLITIYLSHRLILHMPETGDCTAQFRESFLDAMREAHGRTDMEEQFSFSFMDGDKPATGLGVTVHFISSPQFGVPLYSEFGAVPAGDFMYYYRASFPVKEGLEDLAAFLKEIGFKDRTVQPVAAGAPVPATP